jgi:hypothetical protein
MAAINSRLDILRQFNIAKTLGILQRAGACNPLAKGGNPRRTKKRA